MLHIVLYQPEIPPNTGNIIRLCANTGCTLHLIHPLGFQLSEPQLKRAGLDYHAMTWVVEHNDWMALRSTLQDRRFFACSSKGETRYSHARFKADDVLVFGPETRGLPDQLLADFSSTHRLTIPMRTGSRSLNLSNAVAVVVYEALRQLDFVPLR